MSARLMGWVPESGRLDATLGTLARVGATTDNDVVVRVDGVSRTHARIVGATGRLLGRGCQQQERHVAQRRARHAGAAASSRRDHARPLRRIRVRRARDGASRSRGRAAPRFRVRIEWLDGPTRGSIVDIPRGETLIGRAESCAIVIDSAGDFARARAPVEHRRSRA